MNTDKIAASNETMLCPKCGKLMVENPGWPGQWNCSDYKAINSSPPFKFKCTGMILTDEGVEGFEEELLKVIAERN